MSNRNFCPKCGKELSYGTSYCPVCNSHTHDPTALKTQKAADLNFCPVCGKELRHGTAYCTACGSYTYDPAAAKTNTAYVNAGASNAMFAGVLILIYASLLIVAGLYIYMIADDVASMVMSDPSFTDILTSAGAVITEAELASLVRTAGMIPIIAGAAGVAAGVLALMRKQWTLTAVLCIVSALLGCLIILPVIMGIAAFVMLRKARPAFT